MNEVREGGLTGEGKWTLVPGFNFEYNFAILSLKKV